MTKPTREAIDEHVAEIRERPILFTGEMVRAILDGRKTQTRRLVLKSGIDADYDFESIENGRAIFRANRKPKRKELLMPCFGVPCRVEAGMQLWVRETWLNNSLDGYPPVCFYREDSEDKPCDRQWRPSIFMPRWASRITLEVISVRVERLQEIPGSQILAEGACPPQIRGGERDTLLNVYWIPLWDSINGKKHPWSSNPWVWVIEFRKL